MFFENDNPNFIRTVLLPVAGLLYDSDAKLRRSDRPKSMPRASPFNQVGALNLHMATN